MKHGLRDVLALIIIVALGFMLVFFIITKSCTYILLGGCRERSRDGGDFYYVVLDDDVIIRDLTEQGKQKEVITIPERINGKKVKKFNRDLSIGGDRNKYQWESEKLKRVYCPIGGMTEGTFANCTNLEKIIFYKAHEPPFSKIRNNQNGTIKAYITGAKFADKLTSYNGADGTRYYGAGLIPYEGNHGTQYTYYANVSFMYNYEAEENYGYYWIDDFDYGGTIDYVPPFPTRVGYTFGGWYREPECVSPWDFATDTLPEERAAEVLYVSNDPIKYQETRLYAKWIKE